MRRCSLALVLVLPWLVTGCSSDAVAVGVPALDVPALVELDGALFGERDAVVVELTNIGTAQAQVTASVQRGPFELPAEALLFIEPEQTAELAVYFQPDGYAPLEGAVTVVEGPTSFPVELRVTVDADADADGHDAEGAGGDDCDDADPAVHGGQAEVCDGLDTDCNGQVDDVADPPVWWPDLDGDGFGDDDADPALQCDPPPSHVDRAGDCDDSAATTNPDATDMLYDGVDEDCDGGTEFDGDGDGFDCAAEAPLCSGLDCNDLDPAINPDAAEIWYDGVDQDCDGNDDDQDLDGEPLATDCDDLDPTINPSAAEIDDGIDQDCDLLIDEDFLGVGSLVFTELMVVPQAVVPQRGRFVELTNPTDGHVDLATLTVEMGPSVSPLPVSYVEPGGVVLLCTELDPALNGGITDCDATLQWFGATGAIEVLAGGVQQVDAVDFSTWSVPSGASLELRSDRLDEGSNDFEASWCPAQAPYGLGDLGTPGSFSPPCP